MKKYLPVLFLCFTCLNSLHAQPYNKTNGDIVKLLHDNEAAHSMTDVLVKGNIEAIHDLTNELGGVFKYAAGNIAAVRIPVSSISYFIASKDVTRIESYKRHIVALNDTMRVRCNVNEVQNGDFPLTQAYDGSGVILGFIDSGIDFSHPDFIDSLGHTRVKRLWNMALSASSNTPQPYGYGREYNNTEIDGGTGDSTSALREFGHGTHVAGIGAGNGRAANLNKGAAPKADIIMVAYDFTYGGSDTRIADAVHYIFNKADSLGKPCVINASIGDYFGSHDGQDLEAQLIDAEITAKRGRVMVAAGGNWGSMYMHLGYNVSTADTNFTWYNNNSHSQIYLQMWGDSNSFKNIHFALAAEDTTTWSIRAIYPFSTISAHLGIDTTISIFNGSNRIGRVRTAGSTQGNLYEMEFLIIPDSGAYRWRLMTTGTGHFDLWSLDHYKESLPAPGTVPSIVFYKGPDLKMNMSNSFACSNQVITVANYTDRNEHIDCHDTLRTTGETPGGLTGFSSVGPTRDGRIKPDIAAPGDHVMSCGVMAWLPDMTASGDKNVAKGCFHVKGGGTSAASPVVAGIAALYLQKYPHASNMEVKNAITGCAKIDFQTGNALPDNHWGYGKVDAFHALTGCPTGVKENQNNAGASIYPNPFSNTSTLLLRNFTLHASPLTLIIYDITGRALREIEIKSEKTEIERGSFSSGIYMYAVEKEKQTIARGKMIIED